MLTKQFYAMNIVGSHFVPSEHPYQILFDEESGKLGMQVGSLIVLDECCDKDNPNKCKCQTMPVVTYTCKNPIVRGSETFNSQMNMPMLVQETVVWEKSLRQLRVCTEEDKHISLNKFNYLVYQKYVTKIDKLSFYDTPSFLLYMLDHLGISVEWPKEKEQEIILVRAQLHTKDGVVGHWCQSKEENGLFFYANEVKDSEDVLWFIAYQAHFYYTQNNDYTFKFRTEVPDYNVWIEKLNRIVNDYCRHPK